jgi:hypothetical protein
MLTIDESRLRQIVRAECNLAFSKNMEDTLIKLGIRTSTQEDVIEFQKDMAYLRSWRKAVQAGGKRAGLAIVSLAILGVFAAVLAALGLRVPFSLPTQ